MARACIATGRNNPLSPCAPKERPQHCTPSLVFQRLGRLFLQLRNSQAPPCFLVAAAAWVRGAWQLRNFATSQRALRDGRGGLTMSPSHSEGRQILGALGFRVHAISGRGFNLFNPLRRLSGLSGPPATHKPNPDDWAQPSNTVTPAHAGVQSHRRPHRTFSARHLWMPAFRGHDNDRTAWELRPPAFGLQPRSMNAASDRATSGARGQIRLHACLACLPHRAVCEHNMNIERLKRKFTHARCSSSAPAPRTAAANPADATGDDRRP